MPQERIQTIAGLENKAREIRRATMQMVYDTRCANPGHPGGSLSMADILTAVYYRFLRIRPDDPHWPERDRLVLSKGHSSPGLYTVLADLGFFPKDWLSTFRQPGSPLQGHPDMKKIPGVDMTTGSLGNGFGAAVGMALAGRADGRNYRVFCIVGDGESQEGIVWEAALMSAHYKLNNLITILDYNGLQSGGATEQVMRIEPVVDKWRAFGWNTVEIDGHNMGQIVGAMEVALAEPARPTVLIAHTVKGKGVSFMENNNAWHQKAPTEAELAQALRELADPAEPEVA